MFSRIGRGIAAQPLKTMGSRTMATEQQLRIRIATVGNVKKITSTMKMISAAKLRSAQRNLEITRAFQSSISDVWPTGECPEEWHGKEISGLPEKQFILGITSDKGLCGAANSTVARGVRDHMLKAKASADSSNTEFNVAIFGEKGRSALNRLFSKNFDLSITDFAKLKFLTFAQTTEMMQKILESKPGNGVMFSLYFRSMVAYDLTMTPFQGFEQSLGDGSQFQGFQVEGDQDTMENLYQWRQAVNFFATMAECDASVLSSRMAAMENSSKSAGEMLDNLTTVMNRTRQGKITTELIEIISGATAAADMQA